MNKKEGLILAREMKSRLMRKGFPIVDVILFGSVAKGTTHPESDIDLAVVCTAFRRSKHEENVEFLDVRADIDLRIQTVCLHPEDFENKYFTLAKEVERYGIPVGA